MKTTNFAASVPIPLQQKILAITLQNIKPERDFIVFDPAYAVSDEATRDSYSYKPTVEDEGRTLKVPLRDLEEKVYAKLDDFGSIEALRENSGIHVNTQYAVTVMLASDY